MLLPVVELGGGASDELLEDFCTSSGLGAKASSMRGVENEVRGGFGGGHGPTRPPGATLARMTDLDLAWVRARFPGLSDELAFFENAGGSVPAAGVVERASAYLAHDMVQLGAGYPRSARASERVEAGKRAAAALVGAAPHQIALGDSTSMNLYVLAQAFARRVGPGDEVVVTDLDHEANRGVWVRMAKARGATVREWAVDRETHRLTMQGLEAALSERTRLVCFTHCSNVVGAIHDVRAFAARIHEAGARAVVDGVAYAPHRRVDVGALGVDAYALSLYKVYGPHLGLLYVADDFLAELDNQNHFFLEGTGTYQLMPGNVSHELAASLPGVVEYLTALDRHHGGEGELDRAFEILAAHEEALARRILAFLAEHERVRLIGPATPDRTRRVPTIAFTVDGRASAELPAALDGRGVAIRHGHFYAHRAMEAFGLAPDDGVVRISAVHYNTLAEVERLLEALAPQLR